MAKSPLILAALAKAAVPNINFHQVKSLSAGGTGAFDTALLTATTGEHYVVRVANNQAAGAELEVELRALKALTQNGRQALPFEVTNLVGETKDESGSRVLVFSFVYGNPVEISAVGADTALSTSIGKAIAAIHNLDRHLIEEAHLAEYGAAEIVRNRTAELDRLASTGKIPAVLLSRWENALEDVSLFRFQPTVVHGGLNTETVLALDESVSGILGWSSLKISDPAEDFAWILGTGIHELSDSILDVYRQHHPVVDAGLRQRATLYSEIELARWLMHGLNKHDQEIIDDASSLLAVLADDVSTGAVGRLVASATTITTITYEEAVVAPVFEAESVIEVETVSADEDEELEVIDLAKDEYVDDATKPIELPEKTDNELF